jgi:N-acetylmuramoyl-L-alanine amidase
VFALRIALACALSLAFVRQAWADDWEVIKADGRDYVSFANVARFYHLPRYASVNRTVSLRDDRRALRAQAGTSEFYIGGIRFFSDYPLLSKGEENFISAMDVAKIVEPVLRPDKISGADEIKTVVLDPGHGGNDSGTSGPWGNEKTYTLAVALIARDELLRAGFKVEMTRAEDKDVSLEERVDFANRFAKAVFVSIHFNSAASGSGAETYALAPAGVPSNASGEDHPGSAEERWFEGNAHDPANMALAAAVHGSILSRVSVFDRGVRHARFQVLRDSKIPAVLVEAGFLNNQLDGIRIATADYRRKLGQAIATAVTTYNRAINFRAARPDVLRVANSLPPHRRSITESSGTEPPAPAKEAEKPSAAIHSSN